MTYHDLYDEFDCPFPDPRMTQLEGTPGWERRQVMMTYRTDTEDFAAWFGYTPGGVGVVGASIIGYETGTVTWADGSATPIQRRTAVDVAAEPGSDATGEDMFKRHWIDAHPEQSWKHSTELVVGDRVMDLTEGALGLDPAGLPAIIDQIDNIVDPDTGALAYHGRDPGDRRSVHYTAARACNGRTNPQGASHRFVNQWVRLEDTDTSASAGDRIADMRAAVAARADWKACVDVPCPDDYDDTPTGTETST